MVRIIDVILFAAPLLISALTLALMHWFPWKGGVDILSRIEAYTAGTLVTVGVPAFTMLTASALDLHQGELFWAVLLAANTVVSGATVKAAYWYDSKRAIGREDVRNASQRR